jgi:hypothetical protein
MGGQLGDAVGKPDRQASHLAAGRFAHLVRDALAQLKDLLGARESGVARLGEGHATARGLEELVAQRLLQLAHLRADGLHRHVQPLGGPGKAAFLGDDPEVVQMAVVQHALSDAEKPNYRCVQSGLFDCHPSPHSSHQITPSSPHHVLPSQLVCRCLAACTVVPGAWALHAVAVWSVSNAGALSGAASGVGSIALPDWLAPWVPTELVQAMTQMVAGLGPLVDSLLQAAPALAGGLTWRHG